MKKTVQDLQVETKTIKKKNQIEGKLEMKNTDTWTGNTEANRGKPQQQNV